MTWNYRVVRTIFRDDVYEEVSYGIHEVHYNKDGGIWGITDNPISPFGETIGELENSLIKMSIALSQPIIDKDTIVFEPQDKIDEHIEEIEGNKLV